MLQVKRPSQVLYRHSLTSPIGLNHFGNLVLLQPNGEYYHPTADPNSGVPQPIDGDVAIPVGGYGSSINVTLPTYISAARVWLADGNLQFFTVPGANGKASLVEPSAINPSDPSADVNWGFVELTNTKAGGIFVDISYVDFVGLVLGITLESSGAPLQTALGLSSNAVSSICAGLVAQAAIDGQPWGQLCEQNIDGQVLRVNAPIDYISVNPSAFENYWTDYVNQVWDHYTTNPLTINTQGSAGNVSCQVQNGQLQCEGDNRGYSQPNAADIFGCNSGPFGIESGDNYIHTAVVPRLCAAFTRSTLLLPGGNVQPSLPATDYYSVSPTSWYSKLVHEYEVDGKGYAFSYDDVTPDMDVNQSGTLATPNPELLTIIAGGPLSSTSSNIASGYWRGGA